MTASRLQERLDMLSTFRSATVLLGTPQLEAAFKRGTKELPGWWGPQQDEGLVAGVLQHGFGNWGPMFEVGCSGTAAPFSLLLYTLPLFPSHVSLFPASLHNLSYNLLWLICFFFARWVFGRVHGCCAKRMLILLA